MVLPFLSEQSGVEHIYNCSTRAIQWRRESISAVALFKVLLEVLFEAGGLLWYPLRYRHAFIRLQD